MNERLLLCWTLACLFLFSACSSDPNHANDDDDTAGDDDDTAVDDDDSAADDDDSAADDDDSAADDDDDDSAGPSLAVCGDGMLEGGETCDDGNLGDGDGCSASCGIEPQCTTGCTDNSQCPMDQSCVGAPSSVPGATGQCEDIWAYPPGADAPCSPALPCGPGLACLGEFIWGSGWCVAEWFAKDFYSYDDLVIPDDGSTVSSSIIACGLATVPVDIVVTLHLDHPRPQDLLVVLEDPNKQHGVVLNHQIWSPGPIVASVGSGDDTVNGEWTLHVTDSVSGETGRLLGWSVYLLSNWD